MSLITCQQLGVGYAGNTVFSGADFRVEKQDKIGVIGPNGSGKTTLFRVLTGDLTPEQGGLFFASGVSVGCVEQHACVGSTRTVFEELLSVFSPLMELEKELETLHGAVEATGGRDASLLERQSALTEEFEARGGLTYVSRTHAARAGLGFSESDESLPVSSLSGGQRTKLSLGKLLLSEPDCMLLDEPTNHLDIASVEWLEDFLSKFRGALLVISHDRYFLDRVTDKTLEVSGGRVYVGRGSYSTYQKNKALREESERREYEKGMLEIRRIEKMIEQQKRFNRERNYITIASKEKQIERIRAGLPVLPPRETHVRLRFEEPARSGDEVIVVEGLSKAYGEKSLFRDVSFKIFRGEKVFCLGPNGCGKSTLLHALMHKIAPDAGYARFGQGVQVGFFEQTQRALMSDKSLLQEIYDAFPRFTVQEIRNSLGALGFHGEDVEKSMDSLSGGERARAALLELILKRPNLLILDEPTNHLDAGAREVLEEALADYTGTLLCVSHDRYFVNRLADKLLCFEADGVRMLEGNYDTYVSLQKNGPPRDEARQTDKKPNAYVQKKEAQRRQRIRAARLRAIEESLAALDAREAELNAALSAPENAADYEKILELTALLQAAGRERETLEEEWLSLSEEETD